MSITIRMSHILSAAVILFACTMGVRATDTTPAAPAAEVGRGVVAESPEVRTLRSALVLLRGADHDYKGHRVIAMQKIAEACELLNHRVGRGGAGVNPPIGGGRAGAGRGGVGRGGAGQNAAKPEPEPQGTSDAQLKEAQGIVQSVLSTIPAGSQPAVTVLLKEAVDELGIALSIK